MACSSTTNDFFGLMPEAIGASRDFSASSQNRGCGSAFDGFDEYETHQQNIVETPKKSKMASFSESDDDDESTEESSRTPSQSDDVKHHRATRKRRRGIIEKRRRDRINNCLSELRRLVPAAFEKQNSQKLEKAEILQMTVDHLRLLQSRGLDGMLMDSHRVATDYRSMGYRECASEVARYLSSGEGLESHEPIKSRLMSHLQCATPTRPSLPAPIPSSPHWQQGGHFFAYPSSTQTYPATPTAAARNNNTHATGIQFAASSQNYAIDYLNQGAV